MFIAYTIADDDPFDCNSICTGRAATNYICGTMKKGNTIQKRGFYNPCDLAIHNCEYGEAYQRNDSANCQG